MAEANRIQMEKLFNTSEKVLKQWIAKFLGKPAQDLFDTVPDFAEPVLFYPSELSNGKYVELKLGLVDSKYTLNIDELLQEKLVSDTIQFFVYSVRVVYGSIMKTTQRCDAHDVLLDWDPTTLTFAAEYLPDLKKKQIYYNHVLGHMMQARNSLPDDKAAQWQSDFAHLMKDINENNTSIEAENMEAQIEAKRSEWADLDRVGILIRYLSEDEMAELGLAGTRASPTESEETKEPDPSAPDPSAQEVSAPDQSEQDMSAPDPSAQELSAGLAELNLV
jgi:hypothetical protein